MSARSEGQRQRLTQTDLSDGNNPALLPLFDFIFDNRLQVIKVSSTFARFAISDVDVGWQPTVAYSSADGIFSRARVFDSSLNAPYLAAISNACLLSDNDVPVIIMD